MICRGGELWGGKQMQTDCAVTQCTHTHSVENKNTPNKQINLNKQKLAEP